MMKGFQATTLLPVLSDLDQLHEHKSVDVHIKLDEKHCHVEHESHDHENNSRCLVPNLIELPFSFPKFSVLFFGPADHRTAPFDRYLLRDRDPFPKQTVFVLSIK